MSRKEFKSIIEEAIEATIDGKPIEKKAKVISEGPLDFAKSVAGGVKGAGQNVVGNFRTNRARSYMNTFAKKTEKNVEKYGQKAKAVANKMQQSGNSSVKATGDRISQEIDDTKSRVKDISADIGHSFPSSVSPAQQNAYGSRPASSGGKGEVASFRGWFNQNYDVPWDSIGKTAQNQIIDQYVQQQKVSKQGEDDLESALHSRTNPKPPASPEPTPQRTASLTPPKKPQAPQSPRPQLQKPASKSGSMIQPLPQQKSQSGSMVQSPQAIPSTGGRAKIEPVSSPPRNTNVGRQPIVPSPPREKQRFATGKDIGLADLGVEKDEFAKIDKEARKNNPHAVAMITAMKFGKEDEARKHLDQLRNSIDSREMSLSMPPEKSTKALKKVVDKSLEKATKDLKFKNRDTEEDMGSSDTIPQPQQDGTQPIPLTRRKEKKKDSSSSTQPIKKVKPKTESYEPVMSMADFMTRSENDLDQKRFAQEKIEQEKKLLKNKKH